MILRLLPKWYRRVSRSTPKQKDKLPPLDFLWNPWSKQAKKQKSVFMNDYRISLIIMPLKYLLVRRSPSDVCLMTDKHGNFIQWTETQKKSFISIYACAKAWEKLYKVHISCIHILGCMNLFLAHIHYNKIPFRAFSSNHDRDVRFFWWCTLYRKVVLCNLHNIRNNLYQFDS